MIAAGSLFTSCVNYDEPKGVQDLREAKASYLEALSGLRAADAEVQKSVAAINNAKAELEKANAAYRQAQVAALEIENSQKKAEADSAIAAAKAAAEVAAVQYQEALAKAKASLESTQKAIAAAALSLTKEEQKALDNIIDDYKEALEKYNCKLAAVEEAKADLYDAEHSVEKGKDWTLEDEKARLEENIAYAEQTIAELEAYAEEFTSDPDIQAWASYLASLQAEMDQCEYDMYKKMAEREILKVKDLEEGVAAAKAAMQSWIDENWVDPFMPDSVEIEINIPATLKALVPTILALYNGETVAMTSQSSFIVTMAKYVAELMIDSEALRDYLYKNGITKANPYLQYLSQLKDFIMFNFEISSDYQNVIVRGSAEDFDKFINGDDLMTPANFLSGVYSYNGIKPEGAGIYAVYSMITVKNIGLRGILNVIEENDLLSNVNDTTATNAYKKNYEYALANYTNDLDTLEGGLKAYVDADKKYIKAVADTLAENDTLQFAINKVTLTKAAKDSIYKADSVKSVNLFEARKQLALAVKAMNEEGTTESTYSTADIDSVLRAIKNFAAAKVAIFGPQSSDTLSYLKASDLEIVSEKVAISDLTVANLTQTVDSIKFDGDSIKFMVSNIFTNIVKVKDQQMVLEYKYNSYPVQFKVDASNGAPGTWEKFDASMINASYHGVTLTKAMITNAKLSQPIPYVAQQENPEEVFSVVFKALGLVPNFWQASNHWYDIVLEPANVWAADGIFNFRIDKFGYVNMTNDNTYKPFYLVYNDGSDHAYQPKEYVDAVKAYNDAVAAKAVAQSHFDTAKDKYYVALAKAINKFNKVYNRFFGLNNDPLGDSKNIQDYLTLHNRYKQDVDTADVKAFLNSKDAAKKAQENAQLLADELYDLKYFAANASNFVDVDFVTGLVNSRVNLEVAVAMGQFKTIKANYITDAYSALWFACGDVVNELYNIFQQGYNSPVDYPTVSELLQLVIAKDLYETVCNGKTTQELFDLAVAACDAIEAKTEVIAAANAEAQAKYENFLTEMLGVNYMATDFYNAFADKYYLSHTTIYNWPYIFNTEWIENGYKPVGGKALEFYNQYVKEIIDTINTLEAEIEYLDSTRDTDKELYAKLDKAYAEAVEAYAGKVDIDSFTKAYNDVIKYINDQINTQQGMILNFKWELDRINAGVDRVTLRIEKAKRELAEAEAKLAIAEDQLAIAQAAYEAAIAKYLK